MERCIGDRRYLVVVQMQLLHFALRREALGRYVDQVVMRQIQVLQLRVELHGAVDGLDFVVAYDQPLDGGVEDDGEDVEPAFLADDDQRVVVAAAAARAVRERRRTAPPRQQYERCQQHLETSKKRSEQQVK